MNEINDRTLNWLQELIYVDATLPDGKHETSFVLSGVIKERVKSFFSPSSPLHVSR